ncbi:MAG: hypothetical protein U0936_16025 [Planctomycetaceae bacterium]
MLHSSAFSVRASTVVFAVILFSYCCLLIETTQAQPSDGEPLVGRWSNADPELTLSNRHILGAAAALPNGRAIVAGGLDVGAPGFPATAAAEIYDPVERKWTPVKPMSIGRWSLDSAVLTNGKVLFAGGASAFQKSAVLDSAELFNPQTMAFEPVLNTLSAARHSFGISTLSDGRVLLTGGSAEGNSLNGTGLKNVDIYAPETNRFVLASPTTFGRSLHAQVTLRDGRVVVIGGAQKNAEIYWPEKDQWTTCTGLLPTTLKDMKAFETFDGRVFVAGGQDTVTGLTTDETWFLDVSSGQFTPGPSMQGFHYSAAGSQKGGSDYSAFDLYPEQHPLRGRFFLYAGGEHDPPDGPDIELHSSCVFDVARNQFFDMGPMPFVHDDHTEALLSINAKGHPVVLLLGGNQSQGTSVFEFLFPSKTDVDQSK